MRGVARQLGWGGGGGGVLFFFNDTATTEIYTLSLHDALPILKILTHPRSALIKQYTALLGAEGVALEFNDAAIKAVAELASDVNSKMENIGARRLHTIMTTLLEKPLFEQPKRGEKKIKITAKVVKDALDGIVGDPDLSRYIL